MIVLDANNNDQVAGAKVIEAELGQANKKMMIFSGIARPEWFINDDGHTYFEDVEVNLRRTVLGVEQFSISGGLASITNDTSNFLIATNSFDLDIDQTTQELILKVNLAAQGEVTGIGRFSYQVVAIVDTQAIGISGVIKWRKEIFDGTTLTPGQISQTFKISANHKDRIAPPQGFVYDKLTPVAYGLTTGFMSDENDFIIPYEIPSAPYNQPLIVMVEVGALFRANGQINVGQISGPNPITLDLTNQGVTNVDFRVNTLIPY